MAAPHTATIFLSHDEANRHQVAFNEEGTRAAFDGKYLPIPILSNTMDY